MRTFAQKQNPPQQQVSAKPTRSKTVADAATHQAQPIPNLQWTFGRQAVLQLFRDKTHSPEIGPDTKGGANTEVSPNAGVDSETHATTRFAHDFSRIPLHAPAPITMQPKLTVNTPGDIYEQEADHISEQVMRMPETRLQRACACGGDCAQCQTEQPSQEPQRLQTKHVGSSVSGQTAAPPIVHEVLSSPGQPLDPSTRAFMEPRFGHDFSHVRVHSGAAAEQSTQKVNANAYTVGHNIVFGAGRFAPETHEGRRLLSHELAHVVQQRIASVSKPFSDVVQRETKTTAVHSTTDVAKDLKRRQRAKALKAADARTLLQGSLPFVLEHMTDEQIQRMQRVLDAAVVNPEVSKQADDLYRRSITAVIGGQINRDEAMVRRSDRARESFIWLTEADNRILLDYKTLLTPEALRLTTDNPDEVTAIESIRQILETRGVWLRLTQPYVRDPQEYSHQFLDPRTFRAWLSVGTRLDEAIPTDSGRLDRRALLGTPVLGASYYGNVHQGGVESALKKEIHRLEVQIETGLEQHNILASIRRQEFFFVRKGSDWLGGADFPDQSIWELPHKLVVQALELNINGNVKLAQAYLFQAAFLTRIAARLLANYIDDSTSGAERAVRVLTVAKKIGEVAETGLTIMDGAAIVKGGVNLVRGARETAEIGGAVAERVAGRHVAESPAVAVRGTENQVIKTTEEAATEAEKRAITGGKGQNPIAEPSHIGAEASDNAVKKAKEGWFNRRKLKEACVGSVAACEKTRITKDLWTEEDIAREFGETDKILTGKSLDLIGAKHYIQNAIGKSLSEELYDLGANRLVEGHYVIFGGHTVETLTHVVRATVKKGSRLVIYDPSVAGRKITWFGFISKYGQGSRAFRILD